uniref:Growth-regulating factor n=1 Tax=Lolium multiflorum TaxID=4521 RepID=A0A915VLF0_LOLMU|nr:growth-regulating factor 2-like [Lolium multiflorum]
MMLRGQAGGSGRCLFTASQWRELEHQALIYKYMAAGSQVPHELVIPLRHHDAAAVDTAPCLGSCFPPPQPSLGWGLYGMGAQYARKPEDPEPGRCRRTDGKKWRCSREAYGESKYCDRHMHRGKNRSRKPVEPMSSTSTVSSPAPAPPGATYRPSALSISPPVPADTPSSYGHYQTRPDTSAARAAAQLHLDAPSPPPSYHRYAQAQQQYSASPFFPSGGGYGYGQSRQQDQEEAEAMARRRQHCLALGADLSLDKPDAGAASSVTTEEKPLRRFFDECPRDDTSVDGRPWYMGHRDETLLSMSIPTTARYPNGGE